MLKYNMFGGDIHMSIEDFMRKREERDNKYQRKIKKSQKKLKKLIENPIVLEFLTEERKLEALEKKKNRSLNEFESSYQEQCDHNMFALIGSISDNKYYEDIYCITCGKKLDLPKEKYYQVESDLFHQKLLIANYRCISDRTKLPIFIPITSNDKTIQENIEILRQNYYKLYLSIKRRKELNALPNNYSIEDSFFNYFCLEDYTRLINDEKKNHTK